MRATDAREGTTSVNPARLDDTVAEVLRDDAGTFVEAWCRAASGAQDGWAAVPIRSQVGEKIWRIVEVERGGI